MSSRLSVVFLMCKVPLLVHTFQLLKLFHIPKTTTITKQVGIMWWHNKVVDCKKRFIDLFLGLLRSVNDSKVLHRFAYKNAQCHGLFESNTNFEHGLSPYHLKNKGYSLITWITTSFKEKGHYIIFKLLYNRKHKHNHSIVENMFKILKKHFKEFLTKSSLHFFCS
jgi:hypothetical protein